MKLIAASIVCTLAVSLVAPTNAQVTLSGSSYLEDFNDLGSGLPAGWSLYSGAGSDSLGTSASFSSSPASWGSSSGAFKNFASANNPGSNAGDSAGIQAGYADRALGIRQTGSFGDPGAGFVLRLADTDGFASFGMSLDLQMVSVQSRSTTWSVQYRVGDTGSFTDLDSFSDPGTFGSTTRNLDFSGALDNQADPVFIRVAALEAATGSGSRDSFAIDNVALNFTPVPEPEEYGLVAAVLMAGFAWWRKRRGVGECSA